MIPPLHLVTHQPFAKVTRTAEHNWQWGGEHWQTSSSTTQAAISKADVSSNESQFPTSTMRLIAIQGQGSKIGAFGG
ncbi:MAG TPA: hypothetical protein PK299_06480 [Anaerolineales bacterium]|nr:hypothetical protein [Anaerolineales bacterium]